MAQWYPDLVTHVFSVATPYLEVQEQWVTTEELVAGPLPNFGYQLQFGSKDEPVEKATPDKETLRRCLKAAYGGQVPSHTNLFTPEKGLSLHAIMNEEVSMTPLLSEQASCYRSKVMKYADRVQEMDYYVDQFAIHGMHGPCNW